LRHGLTQRSLALRAGTSQSAIARIEVGEEEVTWSRLRALMVSMGEEPTLTSQPLNSRYDARDMQEHRARGATWRLESALAFVKTMSELRVQVRAQTRERVR
jgi:transcriptional regulator with XRE-family HTH domain